MQHRVIGIHTIRYGHLTVVREEGMPGIANVVFDLSPQAMQAHRQIVVRSAQQEPCTDCWSISASCVAREGTRCHVIGGWGGMLER